jgi:hypothetical protein
MSAGTTISSADTEDDDSSADGASSTGGDTTGGDKESVDNFIRSRSLLGGRNDGEAGAFDIAQGERIK